MVALLLGNWQRLAVYAALAAAVVGVLVGYGYHLGVKRLWDYQAEQARETVRLITKQGAVTERVVNRYIKVAGATQVVTQTVEKEVVRYVERNPGPCLDADWGRLHDAAALGTVPPAPQPTDAAPGAAIAIEAVTANYAACHRTADKLDGLQAWVREQQALNAPPAQP